MTNIVTKLYILVAGHGDETSYFRRFACSIDDMMTTDVMQSLTYETVGEADDALKLVPRGIENVRVCTLSVQELVVDDGKGTAITPNRPGYEHDDDDTQ